MKIIIGSIKWQLLVICVALVALPTFIMGLAAYNTFKTEVYSNTEKEVKAIVQDWYILTTSYMRMKERILKREEFLVEKRLASIAIDVKKMIALTDNTPDAQEALHRHISNISIGRSGYVFVLDAQHKYIITHDPVMEGQDFLSSISDGKQHYWQDIFRKVQQLRDEDTYAVHATWTEQPSAEAKMKLTVFSYVEDTQYIIGAVSYHTDYKSKDLEKKLQEELKYKMGEQRIGEEGYIWVINSNGDYIVSKDMYRNGENVLDALDEENTLFVREIIEETKACAGKEAYLRYYAWQNLGEPSALKKMSASMYLPEWDWIIGVSAYEKDFLRGLKTIKRDIFRISIIAVIIGSFVAYFFASFIAGPIMKLEQTCEQAAAGNLDVSMTKTLLHRHDEIGSLSRSFNAMIQSLQGTIAQLRKSDQRFQDIVDSTGDWIWEVDVEGRYIYVSNAVKTVLGYETAEVLGKYFYDFFLPEEKESLKKAAFDFLRQKKVFHNLENKNVMKSGAIVIVETTGVPICGSDGRITGYRGVDRDITARRKAEHERLRLEQELSRAQKLESIGTLAAGIAHEINTPIQFIANNTQFIAKGIERILQLLADYKALVLRCVCQNHDDPICKEAHALEDAIKLPFLQEEIPLALQQSREGIDRVAHIVGAMKDFSHMGSESMAPEDINKAIESTITISRNEWKYIAELQTDLDPSLPFVPCFIGDLKQVILNLIVNAAHAIQEAVEARPKARREEIIIRTYQHDDGKAAIIAVQDTGAGIPENVRDKIFDHFFTTKEVGKGTGQGLAIAYQTIVEKHGGKLWFETAVGVGTTFFISLPL